MRPLYVRLAKMGGHTYLLHTRTALAMVVLFQFLSRWADFPGPLLYLRDHDMLTIAVAPDVPWDFYRGQCAFIQGITLTGLQGVWLSQKFEDMPPDL